MIVKDEEEVLEQCLSSVANFVDEVVIVDTGSSDGTKMIAGKYGQVYELAWEDDFAKARNFSFSKATGDFILWLDADDVLPPDEAKKLPALREEIKRTGADTVMCPYRSGGLVYFRERIIRNCPDAKWRGHVHECIPIFGKTLRSDLTVTHLPKRKNYTMRNLHIYEKWAAEEPLSPRDLFYYGRELFDHKLYVQAEAVLKKMLAGDGWYVNKIEACKLIAGCRMADGDASGALGALFESFGYGEPRSAVLCDIGALFKMQKRYREAVYWYEGALSSKDHSAEGDFDYPACRGIIPLLELVVCCYHAGEREKALEYHKKSEAVAPDHPSVIFNKNFFGL